MAVLERVLQLVGTQLRSPKRKAKDIAGGLGHQKTWPAPGFPAAQSVDETNTRHDRELGDEGQEGDNV